MRSENYPRRYWIVLGCAFVCGAAFFLFAAALILQALAGDGSLEGNTLCLGLAFFALFMGCAFLGAGTLYRASFHAARSR
jgi:hypothetical protein